MTYLSGFHNANNGRLDDVFAVLVNSLQHIHSLSLDLGLDGQIEINTDLRKFREDSQ
jgi:hypothetical protein